MQEQLQKLKDLFPEVFTEGMKIDWQKLRLTLGDNIDYVKERYGLNWPGKADCYKNIQQPSTATLAPTREESLHFDHTQNLFIEGDNLQVLKLLQKSYLGKVKMIYIDPPYNTGKDFVYADNYADSLQDYLEYTGQIDSDGYRWHTNSDADGRFHSNWLSMMYPRLFIARTLLRNDGVIFISIDDNEQAQLKLMCDEIFGEENFIAEIIVDATPKNDPLMIATSHEYILVYTRDKESAKKSVWGFKHPLNDELNRLIKGKDFKQAEKELKDYYKKNNLTSDNISNYKFVDQHGIFRTGPLDDPQGKGPKDKRINPKTGSFLKIPSRGWSCNLETWNKWVAENLIYFPDDDSVLASKKTYLDDNKLEIGRSVIKMQTRKSTNHLKELFDGRKLFDYPKPIELIKRCIQISNSNQLKSTQINSNQLKSTQINSNQLKSTQINSNPKNEIILDFFAGSGTTAHAVMQLNAEDGGNRQFICVQLPEPTDPKSEAYKAGFHNIAQITKERIRRAGQRIQQNLQTSLTDKKNTLQKLENQPTLFENEQATALIDEIRQLEQRLHGFDRGFKAFRLKESNFKVWDSSHSKDPKVIQMRLRDHVDHISPEATQEAMLFELLLKSGFELTTPIEKLTIEGKTVFDVAQGLLLVCLEEKLTLEVIRQMAERDPARVICLDTGFTGENADALKTNAVQIMKHKNILFRTI